MSTEKKYRDDLHKLFDATHSPDLPEHLEEKIMAGVEAHSLRSKRTTPIGLTRNLLVFSLSIVFLSLLAVVQFVTHIQASILSDIKIVALLCSGIFFILWIVEAADGLLQHKFEGKMS